MKNQLRGQAAAVDGKAVDEGKKGDRGEFFAIDYRAWQRACELGLNTAVAYLLLARGTLRDNRTTRWSVHATEGRTGISRPKAKIAIDKLKANGLVENLESSPTRPKRLLVSGHLLPNLSPANQAISKKAAELIAKMPLEASALTEDEKEALDGPIAMGMVRYDGWQYQQVDQLAEEPDWIWLPNSLVDGAEDETPPVENLRQVQSVVPLRLLIDLYHVHSLTFSAGIPPTMMCLDYETEEIAHQREFRVWDVWEGDTQVSNHAPFFQPFRRSANGNLKQARKDFWEAVSILRALKYLDFICHIFDGDGPDAEIIHPFQYNCDKDMTEAENDLHWAAQQAAIALLPAHLRPALFENDIVPVYAHVRHVTAKGIARLRYRPKTLVTSQWMALSRKWERLTSHYSALAAKLPAVEPF